jgi:hypothetical protein
MFQIIELRLFYQILRAEMNYCYISQSQNIFKDTLRDSALHIH